MKKSSGTQMHSVNIPGTIKSCSVTMQGRPYSLISAERRGDKFYHTVKNQAGELKDFEHNELIRLLDHQCIN